VIDVEVTVKFKIENVISESGLIDLAFPLTEYVENLFRDEGIGGLMDYENYEIVDIKKVRG